MKRTGILASLLPLAACAPSASVTPSPGPLAAGDYVSATTGAHIEFTLDEHDWSGLADIQDVGFGLFLADVGSHAVIVVKYTGEIFTDACSNVTMVIEPL